jgi:hypothetical protein
MDVQCHQISRASAIYRSKTFSATEAVIYGMEISAFAQHARALTIPDQTIPWLSRGPTKPGVQQKYEIRAQEATAAQKNESLTAKLILVHIGTHSSVTPGRRTSSRPLSNLTTRLDGRR